MNQETIKGKWNQLKGHIQQQWSHLTDEDIQYINGKYDKLVGKLQEHYGYTEQEAEQKIQQFSYGFAAMAKEAAINAETKVKQFSHDFQDQVRKSPWKAAGISTLCGVVLGMIVRRKFK